MERGDLPLLERALLPTYVFVELEKAMRRTSARGEIAAGLCKRRRRRDGCDESVNEPAKLIEMESVEVQAEVSAVENEPVETIEREDKPDTPAFEDDDPSR